jgi:hypothetical protein
LNCRIPYNQFQEDDERAYKRHHGPCAADYLLDAPRLVLALFHAAVAGFDLGHEKTEKKNWIGELS